MKVGIYGQYYKEDSEEYILKLLEVLQRNKAEVYLESEYLMQIKE